MQVDDWERWIGRITDPGQELLFTLIGRTRCQTDWHIPWRSLDDHLIYLPIAGIIRAEWEDGTVHLVEPWSLLWVRPGTWHHFRPYGRPGHRIQLHHWRFRAQPPSAQPPWLLVPGLADLAALAESLFVAGRLDAPLAPLRRRLLLGLIFAGLGDRRLAPSHHRTLDSHQRESLLNWIGTHIEHAPTPADLAAILDLQPAWFARLFKRSFGCSPRTWLRRQRMLAACDRLAESALSIDRIAADLGFSDRFAFSKQFKATMGCTPGQMRRRQQGLAS